MSRALKQSDGHLDVCQNPSCYHLESKLEVPLKLKSCSRCKETSYWLQL